MKDLTKIIIGVLFVQVAGGALYIWSTFVRPLISAHGYTANETLAVYAITILFFSFGLIVSATMLKAKGPRFTTTMGAFSFGIGVMLAGFTSSVPTLALTYGVLGGIGVGTMYLCPLVVMGTWMPDRPGVANGICIMGFALSTLIFVPIANAILGTSPATVSTIRTTFLIMGSVYLVISLIGARILRFPPNFVPKKQPDTDADISTKEAIKTIQFWLVFATVIFGCIPGAFLISSAASMGIEMVNFTAGQAAALVMFLGVFNAAGRLFAGWLGDKIGGILAYRLVFVLTTLSVALLAIMPVTTITFIIAFAGIVIGFGATISLGCTVTKILFGPKYYAMNVAIIMISFGGSAVLAVLIKMLGNLALDQVFVAALAAAILSLIAVYLIKPYTKESNAKTSIEKIYTSN
ncbi:MAG: MFS transporter [Eubacteriales bacterium]|nr:MFS transporter [Eubacteriales bacterium]